MNYTSSLDPAGRRYDALDRLIIGLDRALAGVQRRPRQGTPRPYPCEGIPEAALDPRERRRSEGFMRVNHAGEVAAQALYEAQGLTARSEEVRRAMEQAAAEEQDHLDWCRRRVEELGGRTSRLDPFWYLGSFAIGTLAGAAGDRWSLGFVAETERQVTRHLDGHLERIAAADERSRAIIRQMREDEIRHGTSAMDRGGRELPKPVRVLMTLCAKVMTTTAYWV
jgi:ubiquinone biosynthesis monooxygenase Coq7